MTTALKARPTTYNGIEMRSRLEARVAAFLDSCEIEWEYEPRAFAKGRDQYLPDFRFYTHMSFNGGVAPLYLEVKPGDLTGDETNAVLDRMKVIHASEPNALLAVADSGGLTDTGMFVLHYPSGSERYAWFARCPECSWVSVGVLLAFEEAINDSVSDRYLLVRCPLCEREHLTGMASRLLMPEWDA